jgi:hypothetical protein
MLILVDSGSSHSFLSAKLASQLTGASELPHPMTMTVANGAPISCSVQFQETQWEVQGLVFLSDFKVLPLQYFDLVVGYDWLELYSPMRIHWSAKCLSIPYGSSNVVLHSILSKLNVGDRVQICQVSEENTMLESTDSTAAASDTYGDSTAAASVC